MSSTAELRLAKIKRIQDDFIQYHRDALVNIIDPRTDCPIEFLSLSDIRILTFDCNSLRLTQRAFESIQNSNLTIETFDVDKKVKRQLTNMPVPWWMNDRKFLYDKRRLRFYHECYYFPTSSQISFDIKLVGIENFPNIEDYVP